ncbi:uncharacterized protein LTR77_000960 [Saxophila tyrrhenica]|uniref:O-methyltransferase C-terminal domain-containing protein n=1 Tax=Saxophila tyrrhenica TaxID=1690608 RepID=A0AAV9PTZ4_9PEZI|nr:hypothetical protein LTR77_000960 [Saxophila tyrrhenica]
MDNKTLSQLTNDIQSQANNYDPNNEVARQRLLDSARTLIATLESPSEHVARLYHHLLIYSTARLLIDTKAYRTLAASAESRTASELAKDTSTDPALLERLLKFVAVENHITETAPDTYVPNPTTHMLAFPEGEGVLLNAYLLFELGAGLPQYFKDRAYTDPAGNDQSAFCARYGKHYFEWISQLGNERELEHCKGHMRFKTMGRKWFEKGELMREIFGAESLGEEVVLLVDVGGSDGFDIFNLRNAKPDMTGRLVLQDLPHTIESLDKRKLAAQGVEAMAYDMFAPQPLNGAKAYFLKMVLHDWPREQCQQALANLRDATTPGYSRILLNEIVVPDQGAGWFETSLDVLMMVVHASRERKEREWRELVEGVEGLKGWKG